MSCYRLSHCSGSMMTIPSHCGEPPCGRVKKTIQWLAETGEPYPTELRDELQPRINQLKSSQPAKRAQPPPPPQPTRWTERAAAKQPVQTLQVTTLQDPKGTQSTPQQVADRERQYMELPVYYCSSKPTDVGRQPAS